MVGLDVLHLARISVLCAFCDVLLSSGETPVAAHTLLQPRIWLSSSIMSNGIEYAFPAGDESDGSDDEWDIGYSNKVNSNEVRACLCI